MTPACLVSTSQGWVVRKHHFRIVSSGKNDFRFKCVACAHEITMKRSYWRHLLMDEGARFHFVTAFFW